MEAPKPTNEAENYLRIDAAGQLLLELLAQAEAAKRYGTAGVVVSINNGQIIRIRETTDFSRDL